MSAPKVGGKYVIEGVEYPSVTTILRALDKPALPRWAASRVAALTVATAAAVAPLLEHDAHSEASGLPPRSMRDAWARLQPLLDEAWLREEPWRKSEEAADYGTLVHDVATAWARKESLGVDGLPEPARSKADALVEFLNANVDEVLAFDRTVYSPVGYAGTFDMVVRTGEREALLDFKTGREVYAEAALQLAAYVNAERVVVGSETYPWGFAGNAYIVHVQPAKCEILWYDLDTMCAYRAFRAALDIHRLHTSKRHRPATISSLRL